MGESCHGCWARLFRGIARKCWNVVSTEVDFDKEFSHEKNRDTVEDFP